MLSDEQPREIIPALDDWQARIKTIAVELDHLREGLDLYGNKALLDVATATNRSLEAMMQANYGFKKSRAGWIKTCITDWHRFRDDESAETPTYESVIFQGGDNDIWEIIMTTLSHGKERVVVHCDGVHWNGVYSADRIDRQGENHGNQ